MTDTNSEFIELHFLKQYGSTISQIPISTLILSLGGIQKAVYLLAEQQESFETSRKKRLPSYFKKRYEIQCSVPTKGSYVQVIQIGDAHADLFAPEPVANVTKTLQECFRIFREQTYENLKKFVPDSLRRSSLINALKQIIPKKGSGILLDIYKDKECILPTDKLYSVITKWQSSIQSEESIGTVTGKLLKIDFSEHKITILYHPTQRELECFYDESIEDLLLENPRELIQVTGQIILDEDDHPKKITEVENIQELDLSPIEIDEILVNNKLLKFNSLQIFIPKLDETQQLLCIQDDNLGIDVCAEAHDDLYELLLQEIEILWFEYALENDDSLTNSALDLKKKLLTLITEVPDAERQIST